MVDHLTPEKRSWNMSKIRGKNTKPEMLVRSVLHKMGYRFRIHRQNLPGTPDIVLPKYKTVIFVHGCYWHRHSGCKRCTTPSSNKKYWLKKFQRNIEKDRENVKELKQLGWDVLIIWECEVKDINTLQNQISSKLKLNF